MSFRISAFAMRDITGEAASLIEDLHRTNSERLKFSFVHMLRPGARHRQEANITKDRTPILASCFSEPFQVWSAKKFPGVKRSTALSKAFADQGIKIPIRKGGDGSDDENQVD